MAASDENEKPSGKLLRFPIPKSKPKVAEAPTFKSFHQLIVSGQVGQAGDILSQLFGIPPQKGLEAAIFYSKKLAVDAQHPQKTMLLRVEAGNGLTNNGLVLIAECFGLSGPFAIVAFQSLVTGNGGP